MPSAQSFGLNWRRQAIRLATVWSQVWREPGGNVTGSSLQLNDTASKRLAHEMPQEPATRLIRCEGDVTTRALSGRRCPDFRCRVRH
jgi:hypothetical protein